MLRKMLQHFLPRQITYGISAHINFVYNNVAETELLSQPANFSGL
jgi:hypothetical protein